LARLPKNFNFDTLSRETLTVERPRLETPWKEPDRVATAQPIRAAAAAPFERLAHFELKEEIGSGGMATVYRGTDLRLHREVAVKMLPPHLSKSESNQKRFQREAQAVAALRHPQIIEV